MLHRKERGHSRRGEELCQAPPLVAASLRLLRTQRQELSLGEGEGSLKLLE